MLFQPPDTYVVVTLGHEHYQTHKVLKNTDPTFKVKFSFSTKKLSKATVLHFIVKDDGFFKDSIIGLLDIQLGEIIDSGPGTR
jgi:hypothetical protein